MSEFVFSTASQLAHSIRSREVSSVEVIEAHLDRIRSAPVIPHRPQERPAYTGIRRQVHAGVRINEGGRSGK